jgi:hypothetical protein
MDECSRKREGLVRKCLAVDGDGDGGIGRKHAMLSLPKNELGT